MLWLANDRPQLIAHRGWTEGYTYARCGWKRFTLLPSLVLWRLLDRWRPRYGEEPKPPTSSTDYDSIISLDSRESYSRLTWIGLPIEDSDFMIKSWTNSVMRWNTGRKTFSAISFLVTVMLSDPMDINIWPAWLLGSKVSLNASKSPPVRKNCFSLCFSSVDWLSSDIHLVSELF